MKATQNLKAVVLQNKNLEAERTQRRYVVKAVCPQRHRKAYGKGEEGEALDDDKMHGNNEAEWGSLRAK